MPNQNPNPDPVIPTNETIIFSKRKHWINLLPVVISTALLIVIFVVASYYYGAHMDQVNKYVPAASMGLVGLFYWIITVGIALLAIWIYRQNKIVLTDHHLVEYVRNGLFDHSISQFSLIKLQDVTARQTGVLANMLGFGTITLETAGEEDNFVFNQMPRAQELADIILKTHEQLEATSARENRSV